MARLKSSTESSGEMDKMQTVELDSFLEFSKGLSSPSEPQQEQQLTFTKTEKVHIRVRDLSIKLKGNSVTNAFKMLGMKTQNAASDVESQNKEAGIKTVLQPTSFDIKAGTVTAIMGGSGSGKTTLLNSISGRFSNASNLVKQGTIEFNGSQDLSSIRHAYVIQQDILLPQLTCFETLVYAAELRLPKLTDKAARLALVDEIILELGLKDCKDTLVGDSSHKGLSGGEKRRLSIGIQMLSNPSVLFLDEPTTGLDAFSAHLLIKTLKNLLRTGKSFVVSIHQPRSDIFFLFDNVILLSAGKLCYGYKCDYLLPYFSSLGFQVPENVNPADFIVDVTSVDIRSVELELQSSQVVARIVDNWKREQVRLLMDEEHTARLILNNRAEDSADLQRHNRILDSSQKAPFLRELHILIRRNLLLSFRDTPTLAALLMEPIVMGLICGWVFYKPGDSYIGSRTKLGVMYTSNGLQGYLFLLFEIYRLSNIDIKVFDMERLEGCVSVPGFILARRISKFFIEDLPIPFLFSVIIYFMVGLRTDSASHYFIFFSGCLLNHMVTLAWGTVCIALSREFALASLYGNLYYTFVSMASGYYVNTKVMPVYVKWSKYLASIWYGFGMLSSNEFTGFKGSCFKEYAGNPNVDTICQLDDGLNLLNSLGFSENWIKTPMCAELAIAIGLFIVAGLVFWVNVVDISLAKQIKSSDKRLISESADEKTLLQGQQPKHVQEQGINVYLKDIELEVSVQNVWKKLARKHEIQKKIILDGINASFECGKLNAIMGPSGSGKSSLLNFISGRISSSLNTTYSSSGQVYFDKYQISPELIRSICSYVSQDDNNLLPTLTVRETLQYAADLRLSKTVQPVERQRIVEEIIMKMGLRDCQNTPIGSDVKKGISGGEKRRVSISIQLLNNPKILLLDEPTSGLDSFTASSILTVLKKLSDEGKTVIMTIHQPRSDLFRQFGTVLLLLKGGKVLFNGSPDAMIDYFAQLGYPVPLLTNLADHVLDMISVNSQTGTLELDSKERVDFLLQNWSQVKPNSVATDLQVVNLEKSETSKVFSSIIRESAPFKFLFPLLCKRQMLGVMRDRDVVINRLTQVSGMGVILLLFFAPLKNNYIGVTNRLMLIQQGVTPLYFVGMLNNICIYPRERNFFYEEYHDNVVGLGSFFWLYLVVEVPFEIFSCFIFSAFVVMVIGLPRTPGIFFAMLYIAMAVINCGESLGIIFHTFINHVGFAMNIISLLLSVSTFMAGLMSLKMGGFLRAINWTSPLHYGVMLSTNMVFRKEDRYTCDVTETNSDGTCIFANGQDVLDQYELNFDYKMLLGVLAVIVVLYRVLTFFVIKLKLMKFRVSRSRDLPKSG